MPTTLLLLQRLKFTRQNKITKKENKKQIPGHANRVLLASTF